MVRGLLVLLFGWLLTWNVAGAQGIAAPSVWENERTSLLYIDVMGPGGEFAGRFHNRAPGYECHDVFVATGRVVGDRIRFFVNFKNTRMDCRTVTNWAGRRSGNTIPTRWKLIYIAPNGRVITKQDRDTFTRR